MAKIPLESLPSATEDFSLNWQAWQSAALVIHKNIGFIYNGVHDLIAKLIQLYRGGLHKTGPGTNPDPDHDIN